MTSSVLSFTVNVNLSQMKVTCSAYNDLYSNVIQESKTVTILSKFLPQELSSHWAVVCCW